jgi:predicted dehydrogenase
MSAQAGSGMLRLGMVGGGAGSQIGESHRIAARLDGRWQLVAGALDIDPARGAAFARSLGLPEDRSYSDWRAMLAGERDRPDRVEAVTVCTPNRTHAEIARAFLEAGFHVLCEKPLATTVADASALVRLAAQRQRALAVMYGYTGYPQVRQMREMVRGGAIGRVRVVRIEFAHGGHARAVEAESPGTAWRYDPEIAGPSGVLADAGIHGLHMASWVTGLDVTGVSATFDSFISGRRIEDNALVTLRYAGGAVGHIWASGIAIGHRHGLRLALYGETGSLLWEQENPNRLIHGRLDDTTEILERDAPGALAWSRASSRVSGGHSEGYFVAFANLYRDLADAIAAPGGDPGERLATLGVPDGREGVASLAVIEAAVASARRQGAWVAPTPID